MNVKPWHLLYIAFLTLLAVLTMVIWIKASDEKDFKVGVGMFRIWRQGNDVVAVPLMAPSFKLQPLVGDGKQADTVTKCGIFKRLIAMNDEKKLVVTVTVLKCGGSEYGISEVTFQTEGAK